MEAKVTQDLGLICGIRLSHNTEKWRNNSGTRKGAFIVQKGVIKVIIDDLKVLLGISDTSQDNVLTIYIRKAVTLISLYLNVPIVITVDKYKFLQPIVEKTIISPQDASVTVTDDGTNTTSQPTNIETTYPDAVIEYATICFNKKGNEGLRDFKFENTAATYDSDGLTKSVKDLLPTPYVKMLGVRMRGR